MKRYAICCLAAALWALPTPGSLAAQGSETPCADTAFRHMDFWVGDWDVLDDEGHLVGRSHVSLVLGRCALREEWDSGEFHGMSINAFDRPDQVWRQLWVDNRGTVLRLHGTWSGDSMVLTGSRTGSDGRLRELRVTLSPQADGTLRQVQQRSEDGGRTWATIFDGRYRPHGQ